MRNNGWINVNTALPVENMPVIVNGKRYACDNAFHIARYVRLVDGPAMWLDRDDYQINVTDWHPIEPLPYSEAS